MKATLTLVILMTFVLGAALIGGAIAQPAALDAGTPDAVSAPASVDTTATEPAASETAVVPAAPEKPIDQGKALYKSVKGGEWLLAFGFLGMLLGSLARFAFGKKWAFLKTKAGGYTIAGFTGMGILGALIIEAGAFSVSMIPTAVTGMLAAMALHGPAKGLKKKMAGAPKAETLIGE